MTAIGSSGTVGGGAYTPLPTMLDRLFADCPQEYFELLPEEEICRLEMQLATNVKLDALIDEQEAQGE